MTTSTLPMLMRNQEEIKQLIKDNMQQQQQNQDKQTNINAELNDNLKSLMQRFENHFLNLESKNGSNSDPCSKKHDSDDPKKVSFQSITKQYFTPKILEFHFGDFTKKN